LKRLKNHPFAIQAHFDNSTVLTFAVPKEQLKNMLPKHLVLDVFQDKWAFIAVAMVQTTGLRPKGFPIFFGNNFFLIGYRIFVRYTNKAGKRLRGLYIIKSETDKKKMEILGNLFTHYNYTTTDISRLDTTNKKTLISKKSDFELTIIKTDNKVSLPEKSPFSDWKEARRYAGPLPFTFTYNKKQKSILIIEGVRKNWKPVPIEVEKYHFHFLESLKLKNVVLANAFEITNVPYHWKKGKLEQWD